MFAKFKKEMKQTHTILIPTMIEPHFELMVEVLRSDGYKAEILSDDRSSIAHEGQKAVHNDMCYPAILVIGQFIDALKSGKFDTEKVALIISQTGGGCRASNYIFLLRKALNECGFGYVPVVSLNAENLDENEFILSKKGFLKLFLSIYYGDLLMTLFNQCVSYELEKGQTDEIYKKATQNLVKKVRNFSYFKFSKNCKEILKDFKAIKLSNEPKVRVGIVGEIYMKYSRLGNNNLNAYLVSEGVEVVNTGLLDFILMSAYDSIFDREIYGTKTKGYAVLRGVVWILELLQKRVISLTKSYGFKSGAKFSDVKNAAKGYISHGVKMGEGWLLTAEMVEFIENGVTHIVCAQPFGCLPNHIIAKGMIRKIKESHPNAHITPVDYDFSASGVNQENRIKLMLSNAKRELKLSLEKEKMSENLSENLDKNSTKNLNETKKFDRAI